jgi:copper chaperone NosL
MKKLHLITRVLLIVGSLLLLTSFKMPIWRIDLTAPQYPEGLSMFIWSDNITGEIEIINGLNHYIGMKHISKEMFPEFSFLNYIFVVVIVAGITVSILNKRKYLMYYLLFLIVLALTALADFYRWGYNYGHNLNPDAPIVVPGMSYQPPVIGHKKLLNFDAYSYPAKGGVIFIAVIGVFCMLYIYERIISAKHEKKITHSMNTSLTLIAISTFLFLASCSFQPREIKIGEEECKYCMMMIMDAKFACEIVTDKGKVLVFDDIHCLHNYTKENGMDIEKQKFVMMSDYANPGILIPATSAFYVHSQNLHSPMHGNTAAFSSEDSMKKYIDQNGGDVFSWRDVSKVLK